MVGGPIHFVLTQDIEPKAKERARAKALGKEEVLVLPQAEAKAELGVWRLPWKDNLFLHMLRVSCSQKKEKEEELQGALFPEAKVCQQSGEQGAQYPFFLRVRDRIQWWEDQCPRTAAFIREGVCSDWPCPVLPIRNIPRKLEDQRAALQVLEEYMEDGHVCEIPPQDQKQAKFLVPWFVIRKLESTGKEKLRLIADCREINAFLKTRHFKLDHWQQIFPVLRKGMWGAKIDLKHAYFHLALSEAIRPYVRMQVGERQFQFLAACFGLSPLPQLWMSLMKVFAKKWRAAGFLVFIYLDDIMVISSSQVLLQKQLDVMLSDLEGGGCK